MFMLYVIYVICYMLYYAICPKGYKNMGQGAISKEMLTPETCSYESGAFRSESIL